MILNRLKMKNEAYRLLQYEINRIVTYDKNHEQDWNVFLSLLYLCVQMDEDYDTWRMTVSKDGLADYIRAGVNSITAVRNILMNNNIESWVNENSTPDDDMPGQELSKLEDRIYYGTLRFTSRDDQSGTVTVKDFACESNDILITFLIVNYYLKINSFLVIENCAIIEDLLYIDFNDAIKMFRSEIKINRAAYDTYFDTEKFLEYLDSLESDGGSISSGLDVSKVSEEMAPKKSALGRMTSVAELPDYVKVVIQKYVEDVGKDKAVSALQDYISIL